MKKTVLLMTLVLADFMTVSYAKEKLTENDVLGAGSASAVRFEASTAPLTALDERSWDYISMQQASGSSGRPDTYEPYIDTILGIVKTHCPAAKLVWHMTWAYQGNSTHSSFPYYNSDQMTMYNAIVSTVQSKILSRDDFSFVIPSGTAVQNLRTSYMGDNLTRDGYHMSYDKGRFVTALTWARKITGCDLDAISWTPSAYSYSETDIAAIKEAAGQAVAHPYVVAPSSYSQGPSAESLKAILTARGYDPDDYVQLTFPTTKFAYYNSTNSTYKSTMYTQENSTQSNLTQFVATRIFTRSELPAGSLIVIKSGNQYRPEGWTDLDAVNTPSTRPDNDVF